MSVILAKLAMPRAESGRRALGRTGCRRSAGRARVVKDILVLFFFFLLFRGVGGEGRGCGIGREVWCGVGSAERYEVRGALLLARREVEKSALKVRLIDCIM
jgi:hypothetical protein